MRNSPANKPSLARRKTLFIIGLVCATLTTATAADVTFHVQRHLWPDDNGQASFRQSAGQVVELDFDDPALGPTGTRFSSLAVGDFRLELTATAANGAPLVPYSFSSPWFDVEGRFFNTALVGGRSMTITADPDQLVLALGTWIFDNGGTIDSAYLVEVTELDGQSWHVVLDNGIATFIYEIEGFVGAVSDVGIADMTITAIDRETGLPHADTFEIDYLKVAGDPFPPEPPEPTEPPTGKGSHKKPKHRAHPLVDPHPGDWAPWNEGPNEYAPGFKSRTRPPRDRANGPPDPSPSEDAGDSSARKHPTS